MRLSSVFWLIEFEEMAKHIRRNAKLADIDDVITPGKKRPACDKDSAICTVAHK